VRTVDFLKFLIAAWAMLSVVPFARQLAAQTSTRVEVSRLDGPVGSRVVVAVHVNEGGGSPRAAGLRGVLRYDPVGLRYVGQVPDRAQVALVNAGVAGAVELAAVPANPRVAPFGGRVAMLVFDVRATGAPAHVRFQTTEAVAGERLVRTTVRDDDAPPTVSAVLPSATLARVMSTDDWVRYVNTGSVDAPRATARGSAGVTVFRSPLQSSSLPCDAPCYGDTNLNGAISLEDGLAVVNWAIRASVLSSVASDSGIAGNVIPANVPGLGETGDSKIPGWDYVTGCYPQYTLSDGLEIVNYSVGLHDPDSSVVGRRIPSDRQKYPSGCTGAPSVSLTDSAGGALNLPGVIARDECIRIGLVAELSNECGDTRLVHALPRTRVLGRERAPMLTYTSQHARPTPGVTLDVRVPVGLAAPDSIVFKTTQNGAVIDSLSIPYMWWLNSTPNQKTEVKRVRIAWNAQSYATGIYPITITATAYYGATTHSSAVATDVIVVNRADSPYGSGWWLAGLDRIIVPSTGTRRLWVGGDGSARIFESVGSNLWVAAAFDRPDTLHFDGTQYERRVLGGGHERFDALGRHVTTVDPQGNTTTFAYQSSVADAPLTTLSVPRLGTPYTFVYQGSGASSILDRIEAPGTTGARIVEVTSSGRDIVSLRDPDLRQVQFMYTDGRVTARTDRRNTVTTLAYEQFGQLARAIVADGSGADTLFTCPAFQLSGTVCERQSSPPTLASLRVINARGISAFFYANAFGAARAVQTPDGTTTLTRGDPRFPAFVTRVDAPDQSIRRATADGRGNLASSTIQNALGDGLERTTTYTWDSQWDALTRITHPLGDFEEFGYDSFTGNLLFRGNGNGVAGRTTYRYGTSGNAATLLQGVTYPTTRGTATDRDSLLYDGLGNVTSLLEVTDSAGIGTRVNARDSLQHDAIGRLRSRCQEITIGSGLHQCTTTTFDAMSRDSVVTATGPALNNTPAQTLTVRNAFDAEGNVLSVQRQASDGTIGAITTSWLYDRWHRPTRETAPDNAQEFRYYDRAGNVDSVRTRRGHLIQMTYDGMNRLTRRVLPAVTYAQETPNWSVGFRKTQPYPWKPNAGSSYVIAADTTSFVYDNMGRMTRATNGDSRIGRSYLPNGALARDTLQIRATTLGGWLVYPLEHRYDANGRRTSLKQPTALVPDSLADSIRFRYDAITGNLDAVTDVLGNQFTFVDDLRQLPGALLMPNGHAQRRASRMTRAGVG
jgi:YD repeat-containing protein